MRIFFVLFLMGYLVLAYSQSNQGQIIFEEKIDAHRNLPPEMEAFKDRIPQFRTTNKILFFTPNKAYYVAKTDENRPNEFRGNRRGYWGSRLGRSGGMQDKLYTDLTTGETKSEREFFGKKFLIEGNSKVIPWKFTGKQKQVGSFLCQEAVYQDTTQNIVAWFTPMIPVAAGPGEYAKLPGMILHIDINDGEQIITAMDINLNPIEENNIVQPTDGEKISQTDFDDIVQQKTKEMEAEWEARRGDWTRRRRNN